jgi:hypothetical protein
MIALDPTLLFGIALLTMMVAGIAVAILRGFRTKEELLRIFLMNLLVNLWNKDYFRIK